LFFNNNQTDGGFHEKDCYDHCRNFFYRRDVGGRNDKSPSLYGRRRRRILHTRLHETRDYGPADGNLPGRGVCLPPQGNSRPRLCRRREGEDQVVLPLKIGKKIFQGPALPGLFLY